MTMGFELLLLCALIFIFIVSFCGLLQKIRQSYERERIIADRVLRQRQTRSGSFEHVYQNSGYLPEANTNSGIFPSAPPPYSQVGPPPKYDDIVKDGISVVVVRNTSNTDRPEVHVAPPAYVIAVSTPTLTTQPTT